MRLGTAPGTRIGSEIGISLTIFDLVRSAAQGRTVLTADYYAVDSATGKVAAFVDWNDPTHTYAQPTSTKQVELPVPHNDFAGKLCVTASVAGTNVYTSTRTPAYWKILHSGNAALYMVGTPTSTGAISYWWQTGGDLGHGSCQRVLVGGSLSTLCYTTLNGGALAANVPTFIGLELEDGGSAPEVRTYIKSTQNTAGTNIAAVDTTDAGSTMHIFSNDSTYGNLRWRSLFIGPAAGLSRQLIYNWIQQDTGIAP